MSRLSTNPFSFVGRPVRDEYGRQIGRIASFVVSPSGRVKGVFVDRGDGKFLRYSSNRFKIKDDVVVIFSSVKLKAEALCNEMPLIWRKDQALSELLEKRKISQEMFNKVHENFENALDKLKADAQASLDNVSKQITRCVRQIKELRSAITYLELEHAIGKIDEKLYQTAMEKMQETLKRANLEKGDLEAARNKLSNLLEEATAGVQAEAKKEALPAPPALPEPPVEVRLKS